MYWTRTCLFFNFFNLSVIDWVIDFLFWTINGTKKIKVITVALTIIIALISLLVNLAERCTNDVDDVSLFKHFLIPLIKSWRIKPYVLLASGEGRVIVVEDLPI